jgi:hypothetical protein
MHNPKLADKQGVSVLNRRIIDKLHILRDFLVLEGRNPKHQEDKPYLRQLYDAWFSNEQLLQELWNFELNDNFIRFWEAPGCICPRMDNEDNYPHGYYVTRGDCPIHGDLVYKD